LRRARPAERALLAAGLLATLLGPACRSTPQTAAPHAEAPTAIEREAAPATPALWRFRGRSGGTLYVLGSLHVGRGAGWSLSREVLEAFDGSDLLLVELDLRSEATRREIERAIVLRAQLPRGESLSGLLPPELYREVARRMEPLGVPQPAYDRLKPWFISNLLAMHELERSGFVGEGGVDRQLMERAGSRVRVEALETPESQLELMDGFSSEIQRLMLEDTLLKEQELRDTMAAMIESWRHGDEVALEALVFRDLHQHPELLPFYEAMLFERNEAMASSLSKRLDAGGTSFAVVGAGHLVGAKGVVARLRERGYRGERVDEQAREAGGGG